MQPLLILDSDLRVRVANAAFYRTFASEPDEALGARIYELGDGQWDIPDLRRLLGDVLGGEMIENYEVEHDFPGLGERIMLVSAHLLRDTEQPLILVTVDDATDRIRAERERAAYAAELKRSNRELQQFAYVASHDLQEPLRTLSSFSQLLERRYRDELDERARSYIDFMVDAAGRMQRLIRDLLRFSRAGTASLELADTPLREPLDDALARLRVAADEADAEIEIGPLPTVRIDPRLMTQVFQNLVGNAIKHHGDHPPRVRISAEERPGDWLVGVRDHGPGVPEEYRERIFGIFERLDGRGSGTGIGLAIARRAVERHGGEMWLEAPEEGGALVRFTLPREIPPELAPNGEAATEREREP